MMRITLGLEYDGSAYHGWQYQPNLLTVQGKLETALSKIADHPIRVYCAGRTDTAVHATSQVVHFDTNVERPLRAWQYGVNSRLPNDITVRWVKIVDNDFHARFSALTRRYCYVIYNHAQRPALYRRYVSWQFRPLNEYDMAEAAQCLVGRHDFTSYRAVECQSKSPIREVSKLKLYRQGDLVVLDITANGFLHHMVRNIAGALIAVGTTRRPVSSVAEVLASKDRCLGAETAPPYGLYLIDVQYPERFEIKSDSNLPLILAKSTSNSSSLAF